MEYDKTVNLPKTAFPMKADLVRREPQFQQIWAREQVYQKLAARNTPKGRFVLHDGPPYSNGDIHMGHAMNKILKDIVVKSHALEGYATPYVPGWDNHGLPIENEVSREFRRKHQQPDRLTLRRRCREYAAGFVQRQREQFERLGVLGDWDHPYLTMDAHFEATIVRVFGEMVRGGYIYRGLKPVMWCPDCETALADAEIEYHTHTSPSIMVAFTLKSDPDGVFGSDRTGRVLIWTTTPWTIPANMAVAVHPDEAYVLVDAGPYRYLLAEALLEPVMERCGISEYTPVATVTGNALSQLVFSHPLYDRESPVVLASYVTMTDGTGVVHTAPGHGADDFQTGMTFGLDPYCPVDAHGRFMPGVGERIEGVRVQEANQLVIDWLDESGALMAHEPYEHQYPYCWRCHNPLIYRATVQWFMNIDHNGHRQRCLEQIESVQWFPRQGQNRIKAMVEGRPDWCLSRQRSWGVGIPAFHCADCGHSVLDHTVIERVADIMESRGSDVWYEEPAAFFLGDYRCPACGGGRFEKETDILDVWFDSGSTHRAVLEARDELQWPADVYLEGSDQHRGWFNSSLMIAVATRGAAPYRQVITSGWMLDGEGKAMHKSRGNVIAPKDVINKYGADVLRLWVSGCNYFEDVRMSYELMDRVAESYRRIRNTMRFILGNLSDYDPETDTVAEEAMHPLDRWALAAVRQTAAECRAAYQVHEFNRVFHALHNVCAVELSSFYLDVLKDRLYAEFAASHLRRSAQTALSAIARLLTQLMAPILSHTAEEVWQLLPDSAKEPSVFLSVYAEPIHEADEAVLASWQPVIDLRTEVNRALETARQEGQIKRSQDARVSISVPNELHEQLTPFTSMLSELLMVSECTVTEAQEDAVHVSVSVADGAKCPRCWRICGDIGADSAFPDVCGRCAGVLAIL